MESIDNAATVFLNGLSGNPVFDVLALTVTRYGALVIVAAVAVRWWWHGHDKDRERHLAILCGASVALGLVINQVVLLFVHRTRPYDAGLTHLLIAPSVAPPAGPLSVRLTVVIDPD